MPFGLYLHSSLFMLLKDLPRQDRIDVLKEFIAYTQTLRDVYWVTNQQLLAWMMSPTDKAGSLTNPALGCTTPAQNSGVCDGIGSRGEQCVYDLTKTTGEWISFYSCFSCPVEPPRNGSKVGTGPIPAQRNSKLCFVPNDGCPHPQIWDAVGCRCTNTARLAGGVAPVRSFTKPAMIAEWLPKNVDPNERVNNKVDDPPVEPPKPTGTNYASTLTSTLFVASIITMFLL